jgi:hypothetical protein
MSKIILSCSLAVALTISAGCGSGQEASVTGLVTLDGAPVERGRIMFVPAESGAGAFATIKPDGKYAARTGSASGLEPGDYLIAVQSRGDSIRDPKGGPPLPGKLLTPKKYAQSRTSEFQISIEPGSNEVDFELKSGAK